MCGFQNIGYLVYSCYAVAVLELLRVYFARIIGRRDGQSATQSMVLALLGLFLITFRKISNWQSVVAQRVLDLGCTSEVSYNNTLLGRVRRRVLKSSAFLKHAFREVTCGFCKGTVPGAPPLPFPGPLRMPKKIIQNVLGTTRGAHLGEEHVKVLSGRVEVPYQGRPLPLTQGP